MIILFLLAFLPLVAWAVDFSSPKAVIEADIIAQNTHDLSTYLSIRTTKLGPPENRNDIKMLRKKYPQYDILQNAVKTQLVGIKSIPISLAGSITKIDKYFDLYSKIKAYYVAINYQLKKENRYFYNGVNYRLYLLGLENGHWVIIEVSHLPIHQMIEAGYGFGTLEEKKALKIQERRERTGEFIDLEGKKITE